MGAPRVRQPNRSSMRPPRMDLRGDVFRQRQEHTDGLGEANTATFGCSPHYHRPQVRAQVSWPTARHMLPEWRSSKYISSLIDFLTPLYISYWIQVYECADILSSNVWTLVHPELKTNMNSCSSCSWSTCFNLPILLALGCDEPNSNSEKLAIFEYNENIRTYSKIERPQNAICTEPIRSLAFAPSVGKLYHVLAIASKSLLIATFKTM